MKKLYSLVCVTLLCTVVETSWAASPPVGEAVKKEMTIIIHNNTEEPLHFAICSECLKTGKCGVTKVPKSLLSRENYTHTIQLPKLSIRKPKPIRFVFSTKNIKNWCDQKADTLEKDVYVLPFNPEYYCQGNKIDIHVINDERSGLFAIPDLINAIPCASMAEQAQEAWEKFSNKADDAWQATKSKAESAGKAIKKAPGKAWRATKRAAQKTFNTRKQEAGGPVPVTPLSKEEAEALGEF